MITTFLDREIERLNTIGQLNVQGQAKLIEFKEIKEQLILSGVVYSNRYKTDEYLVYTPSDDESVVVIEDTFKTQKTVDIKDFNNLMSVLHSVQDY